MQANLVRNNFILFEKISSKFDFTYFQLVLSTLLGLSTQSLILPPETIGTWFRIATPQSNENLTGLVLTNPFNLFSSFKPAEHIRLPTLPANGFLPSLVRNIKNPDVISTTVAPLTEIPSVTPSFRLPVTTRPPGVPHHDDNIVQYQPGNGGYRIVSNRQTFEFRETVRKPTATTLKPVQNMVETETLTLPAAKIPINTPVETAAVPFKEIVTHLSPPLIRSDKNPLSFLSVRISDASGLTILNLPKIPYQPFFEVEPSTIVSRIQTLPFQTTFITTSWNAQP